MEAVVSALFYLKPLKSQYSIFIMEYLDVNRAKSLKKKKWDNSPKTKLQSKLVQNPPGPNSNNYWYHDLPPRECVIHYQAVCNSSTVSTISRVRADDSYECIQYERV